jgi:hypothetical protein
VAAYPADPSGATRSLQSVAEINELVAAVAGALDGCPRA